MISPIGGCPTGANAGTLGSRGMGRPRGRQGMSMRLLEHLAEVVKQSSRSLSDAKGFGRLCLLALAARNSAPVRDDLDHLELVVSEVTPQLDRPTIPDVDVTFALNYANDHDRAVCRILGCRLTQADPNLYQIYSVIKEVATQGGFNYETAGFVIGAAMSASCPQHVDQFEAALGEEIA